MARIEPDPEQFSATRGWGRRTWHREAHTELARRREQAAQPIPVSRPARLLEALHRLEQNQHVEIQASEAYEKWWTERRTARVSAQKLGMPPKPYVPPAVPDGLMNKTRWDEGMYAFMRRVLASDHGAELYRHRKATVEPVFAQNKFNRGFRRFQRRGRAAARSEWRLQAAVHNLLKLHSHWIDPAIA